MRQEHLSEKEIQLYALEGGQSSPTTEQHVESCEHCRAAIAAYQMVFTAMKKLDTPAFDFDVAALVLPQLETEKSPARRKELPICFFGLALCIGLLGFIIFYFGNNLPALFSALPPMGNYLILCPALMILLFQIMALYRQHQQQLKIILEH